RGASLSYGLAGAYVSRGEVPPSPPRLSLLRDVIPADPDLARLGPAHHLDLRRAPAEPSRGSPGDASRGRPDAGAERWGSGEGVERPGRDPSPARGHGGGEARRGIHAQGRVAPDQRQRADR